MDSKQPPPPRQIALGSELYDVLRALMVETEETEEPRGPRDVGMNLFMMGVPKQEDSHWERLLDQIAELGLVERVAAGQYRVTAAGYGVYESSMQARIDEYKARLEAGHPLWDED